MVSKKTIKILVSLFAAVVILIGIVVKEDLSGLNLDSEASIPAEQRLEIHYLDVGQGDAILIKTPENQKILIDGGPDMSILDQLGGNLAFFDRNIDVMILTHPHADHLNGLVEVIRRYDIGKIYYTGVVHTSPAYFEWLEVIKQFNVPMDIIKGPKILELGDDLQLEFLYPFEDITNMEFSELNNTSIVNKLIYKDKSFLFMGDAEKEVEQHLIDLEIDINADVIKLGHHGSSSSSSEEFLQIVNPEYAIIQCGADNNFGHPHLSVIRRLERLGINILRNDLNGQVSIFSNGEEIEVVTEK